MEELVPETPEVKTSTLSSPVTRLKSKASSGALRREVEAMNACPSPQPSQTSSCPSKYDPFRSVGSLADGEHVEYMRALRVGDYMCRYIGSKDFADAVVRTDLRDIPVHKVVLASKYPQLSLNLLFQDDLDLSDVSYGHVSAWLKYVYTNDASALEVVPTEILGQIARFVSSGHLSKCNMSSSPVTSTPTIAKNTNMSAARKPSSTTSSSSRSHGIGQSSLATRGRRVDLVVNVTDEKELANSIRLRDNHFCQPNKSPAVPSRNSRSKTGAIAGKDRNKRDSLLLETSPVIPGQTHDSRKPSGTDNTSRDSGSTRKRNAVTPTIRLSVASIRSKKKSNVAAAPSPSLAAKISKRLRNRNATKVVENSSRSKPRRDGTSCAKGRNQSPNNEPNVKKNRGGKPSLRHCKGCTDDDANRDIDGNPQKQLTVQVLNLSHISTEFPTKLSDWTELLSPVRLSPSGDQNSAASCGDSEIVALESDCGSTVRSASVASVPKENVEENCESNVAPDESVKDGSVSTQSVEDSKVSVDDVNSAKADNIGDSNVNNISRDRSEGVQGAKSTPSPVIKSRADQTHDRFASDINADAIKLLSQHCRLVDLTSDSADATAVVNLADEESSCSESIDVEIVDEYEGSTDTGEAVDVKGTSLAIDVSASSTLHHMSSTSCQEGETTAESHAAIEFHGSSSAPMGNVGGKDTKFHASMISSVGEELPSLSDMEDEPVDSVVCVPEEETALVSNKLGPEVMDSNMGENSTLVADDSQLEMVGGECGPADCRDSPSGSMSHPKMAGDGKRVQRGKSSPPEREMATPKRQRRTHRAYVPSPFTPMEDWHSHSDHTLKAKLRGFGLRDKMSRKRMISALTQIYVETHAYETDTSAEFTSLPTPDKRAELTLSQPQANDNDVVSSEHQSVHVDVDLAVADDLKEKQAPQASDPNSGSRSDIDQLLGELDKLIESDEESPANRTRTFNSSSSEGELSTDDESDSGVIGGGCDDATPKDIDTALRLMMKKNTTLYDRILRYEMIPQEELVELVKGEGLKCSLAALRSFCFKQCIPVQNKQDQARRRKLPGVKKKPK